MRCKHCFLNDPNCFRQPIFLYRDISWCSKICIQCELIMIATVFKFNSINTLCKMQNVTCSCLHHLGQTWFWDSFQKRTDLQFGNLHYQQRVKQHSSKEHCRVMEWDAMSHEPIFSSQHVNVPTNNKEKTYWFKQYCMIENSIGWRNEQLKH